MLIERFSNANDPNDVDASPIHRWMTLKYPLPRAKRIALVKLFYQSMY